MEKMENNCNYYGHTPIYVSINGDEYYITLKKLFERYEKYVQHNIDEDFDTLNLADFKSDIKVWCENGFTKIKKAVKGRKNTDIFLSKTYSGNYLLSGGSASVITENGCFKKVRNLSIGEKLYKPTLNLPKTFEGQESIKLPEKFIYYLGYVQGDGDIQDDASEKFDFDKLPLNYLNYFCPNMFGCVREGNSYTKHLPISFMKWHKDCMSTFIAGLIDATGHVEDNGLCVIQSPSYAIMVELYDVLKYLDLKPNKDFSVSSNNVPQYSVIFIPNIKIIDWCAKYHTRFRGMELPTQEEYTNYEFSDKLLLLDRMPSFLKEELDYLYGIETESGYFTANGLNLQ